MLDNLQVEPKLEDIGIKQRAREFPPLSYSGVARSHIVSLTPQQLGS